MHKNIYSGFSHSDGNRYHPIVHLVLSGWAHNLRYRTIRGERKNELVLPARGEMAPRLTRKNLHRVLSVTGSALQLPATEADLTGDKTHMGGEESLAPCPGWRGVREVTGSGISAATGV